MRFQSTPLPGVWLIEIEPREDQRGYFARTWCREEFARQGIVAEFTECCESFNARRGTLRGLHYQVPPHEQSKLVRVVCGAIYDVVLDLRADSPTFRHWFTWELSHTNQRQLYIPHGCAHGFQTLYDDTIVLYQLTAPHHDASFRVVRWNDPAFAITWPEPPTVIHPRDTA